MSNAHRLRITWLGLIVAHFAYEHIVFDITQESGLKLIAHTKAATRGRLQMHGVRNGVFIFILLILRAE